MKTVLLSILLIALSGCGNQMNEKPSLQSLFPKGDKNPTEHFNGSSWTYPIVSIDTVYQMLSGSVHFEPKAHTDWHSHPGGQILIITEGVGYYQEEGQSKRIVKKGDIIKCMPNVKHWHGAGLDSPMTFIHMIPNTENGYLNWFDAVTSSEYNN